MPFFPQVNIVAERFEQLVHEVERLTDFISTASVLLWETGKMRNSLEGRSHLQRWGAGADIRVIHAGPPDNHNVCRPFLTIEEALRRDPATDPAMSAYVDAIRAQKPYRGFEYSLPGPDQYTDLDGIYWQSPCSMKRAFLSVIAGTCRNITQRKASESTIRIPRTVRFSD